MFRQRVAPSKNGAENTTDAFIRLRDVRKVRQTAAGDLVTLKDINVDFYKGTFVGIVGKSGAGKSTLINVLSGVTDVSAGEVWMGNTPVHKLNESNRALWRGNNLGIVYQSFQLLPNLTLLENVMLPMDFCGLYKAKESREKAMHLLDQVEIADHAHKIPSRISGGQQQRAAIARALANDPPVLVADEPTGNLDSVTAETIFELFAQLIDQGRTIIMVTHDRHLAARTQHRLRIADGEITENSHPIGHDPRKD